MLNLKGYQAMLGYVKNNYVVVNNLKEELKLLEDKEKYLRSISLQEQANISRISDISRIWESSPDDTKLNDKVISNMESLMSQCELVSANQEATAKMVQIVVDDNAEDSDEENVVDTKKGKVETVAVKKHWQLEGKVEQISYAISFVTVSSSEDPVESLEMVLEVALSVAGDDLEVFKQSVKDMDDLQTFTLHLHTYQLLVQERIEAMDELEDFENMEVRRSANPVQLLFVPIKDFELNVLWKVVWDNRNHRFKNEIWIDCTDDVVARFSQKEDAFPFLNGSKILRNKKQVIQFFGYFVDDLLESNARGVSSPSMD